MTLDKPRRRPTKRKSSDSEELLDRCRSLDDAVDYFTTAVRSDLKPKLRGNVRLQMAIERVEEVAFESGLSGDIICQLMDVVVHGSFPVTITTRLIKSLIPATVVPASAVLQALSWMCTNKPSANLQALLIRWLVVLYEFLEKTSDLHALYHVLFYFLDNAAVCPDVCHLLYLLTRKEDVKLFRIRNLLHLQKKMGPHPYLLGLLSVYKLYQPKFIVLPKVTKTFFRQTDRAWVSNVREVLDRRRVERPLEDNTSVNQTLVIPDGKRPYLDLVPPTQIAAVTASRGKEFSSTLGGSSRKEPVPISQISSFKQLLQNFDRLELPGQVAAALRDRNLQHVLLCYPDPTIATRMGYWLDHVLCEEFLLNPSKDSMRREKLLKMLISFSDFLMEGVPVCEHFLMKYLHVWNGSDFREDILQLVARFRLHSFQELNDLVFEPLRKLFFCSSVYFKCELILCLTTLVRNFAMVELPRYNYCVQRQANAENLDITFLDEVNSHCVFEENVENFCPEETISQCIQYVNSLVVVGLQTERGNALLMHCVLGFYELVSGLHQDYGLPFALVPSRGLVYQALFSIDAVALSRICEIICRYRAGYTSLQALDKSTLSSSSGELLQAQTLKRTRQLNLYILDISNTLWRHQAFMPYDKDTVYKLLKPGHVKSVAQGQNTKHTFSVLYHPALIGVVQRFLKKNVADESRRHPSFITDENNKLLKFFDMDHVSGISKFIATNIKTKSQSSQ